MPILENAPLIHCEKTVYDILSELNSAEQLLNPLLPQQMPMTHQIHNLSKNDEDCQIICVFYLELILLINKSLNIKHGICSKKTSPSAKQHEELEQLKIKVSQYTETLRSQYPEHWNFLLSRQIGRLSLYYLINLSLINNLWGNSIIIQMWIIELMRTSTSAMEINLLEHLKILAIQTYHALPAVIDDELLLNPYVSLKYELSRLNTKEELVKILSTPLEFFEGVPVFTIHFVKLNFSYKIIQQLFNLKFEPDELLALFEGVHIPSFFAQKNIQEVQTTQDILALIYFTYNHMRIYARLYSLSLDKDLIYKERHPDLLFILLNLFKSIQIKSYIHPDTYFMLAQTCGELISTGNCAHWTNYASTEKDFWEITGLIFNFKGIMNPDMVELISIHGNTLVDNLAHFGFVQDAYEVLQSYIELNDIHRSLTKSNQVYFMSLLGIFKFCTLLPILVNNLRSTDDDDERQFYLKEFLATSQHIFVELDHLKTSIIKRFWPKVPQFFTPFMLHYLKEVHRALNLKKFSLTEQDHLYKLQIFCNKLSRIAEAEKSHLELIQAYLKQDELSEIKTQELLAEFKSKKEKPSKEKAVTKSRKTTDSPKTKSITPLSLFSTPSLPPQYIPISEMPSSLLHLAKQVKARFSTNLILVGGALTNLFLKRPNPNDYDCLVFNLNLTELNDFLLSSGYRNSIIVGKQYPIIKVKIETDGKILELDLTTVNTSPSANLHDAMAEILCKRDFKLSALYLDLIASGPHFEIKGFDHAIHSINQKRISFVHDPKRKPGDTIFTEDPLRTFRLVKILLQYPDFTPDSHLQHTLKMSPFKTIFSSFLSLDLNQARIGTAIELLFKRFKLEDVIDKLGTLGILEGLTGFNFKKIQPHLSYFYRYLITKIPEANPKLSFQEPIENLIAYTKKLAFFQFLCIYYCLESPDQELHNWACFGLIKKVKISDQAFSLIHRAMSLNQPEILVDPELIRLTKDMQAEFELSKPKPTTLSP